MYQLMMAMNLKKNRNLLPRTIPVTLKQTQTMIKTCLLKTLLGMQPQLLLWTS
jgi:hypothetical protein